MIRAVQILHEHCNGMMIRGYTRCLISKFSNFKAVVEGNNEGVQLCAANDSLAKPSYARTPLTCWLDAQGIQADFQKVIRLLRKIPDRTVAFYSVLFVCFLVPSFRNLTTSLVID